MNWTNTPPTKPGAYWWRQGAKDNEPILAIIERSEEWDGELIDVSSDMPPKDVGGEWCGPLVPAEEVGRAYYEGHIHAISSDPDMDPQEHSWPNSRARKIVEGEL